MAFALISSATYQHVHTGLFFFIERYMMLCYTVYYLAAIMFQIDISLKYAAFLFNFIFSNISAYTKDWFQTANFVKVLFYIKLWTEITHIILQAIELIGSPKRIYYDYTICDKDIYTQIHVPKGQVLFDKKANLSVHECHIDLQHISKCFNLFG